MFENILVYLDGRGESEKVLPFVAQLAGRFGSKVILLNVIVIPPVLSGWGKPELEPEESELVRDSEVNNSYLDSVAGTLRKNGLDVECVTVQGPLEDSILACARASGSSLIALAAHDHGFLNRLIIGSTAGVIFRKSGIPVLSLSGNVQGFNK
jgi:nucleotide-binding universal stress UspA family protein